MDAFARLGEALRALGPNGRPAIVKAFAAAAPALLREYQITTPLRLAHFWAQVSHECNGFRAMVENLNYSVEDLISKFGRHRISIEDANRYGRAPGRRANQEAIANAIYGGPWGRKNLGNTEPGDGWRFRGRGGGMLTGRSNYAEKGRLIGVDLVANPDLAADAETSLRIFCEFWKSRGLNKLADANNMLGITKKVNGGTNGLADRKANFVTAWRYFGNGAPLQRASRPPLASREEKAIATGAGAAALEQASNAVNSVSQAADTASGLLQAFSSPGAIVLGLIILGGAGFLLWRWWKGDSEDEQ